MSDILALIDGAIRDATSPDAMRWTPEPEAQAGTVDGEIAESLSGYRQRWVPMSEPDATPSDGEIPPHWYLHPNPPLAVREAMERREIARILAEFPTRPPVPEPPREPVIQARRLGCLRVPFVGGPRHGDVRTMEPPLPNRLCVPLPMRISLVDREINPLETIESVMYQRRRVTTCTWETGGMVAHWVYATSDATQRDLEDALVAAMEAGWQPREATQTPA